jgi:uncharacterized protein (TIGR02996 family)
MTATLAAINRAVIASPTDRTVRLVYADALEETGDPVHRARAEFIRAQIEYESAGRDPPRPGRIPDVASKLFEEHWRDWWHLLAEEAGLPAPPNPGKRVRDRVARVASGRRRRQPDGPYTISPTETTVHLAERGLSFKFGGGFPEEVRIHRFVAPEESGPEIVHRWGELVPLVHLRLPPALSVTEWESVVGPHLARLDALTIDSLLDGVAPRVAASPALANLRRLVVDSREDFRPFVAAPPWVHLRALRLGGQVTPNRLREVVAACTLQHLEELDLVLGNPSWLIEHMVRAAAGGVQALIRSLTQTVSLVRDSSRFGEYGPALEELAATRWIKGLRVLRLVSASATSLGRMVLRFNVHDPEQSLPDAAVLALAEALDRDKLERLVLPTAFVGPAAREELTNRLGSKVEFR